MIISEKIFYLLNQKGITQKDFAVQTGISQSTISDWKRKKTNPSADKILKICEILHVTPYELLSERDEAIINNIDHLVALNDEEAVVLEGFRNLEKRKKERQGQRLHRSSRNPIHANERQDKLFSRCL